MERPDAERPDAERPDAERPDAELLEHHDCEWSPGRFLLFCLVAQILAAVVWGWVRRSA